MSQWWDVPLWASLFERLDLLRVFEPYLRDPYLRSQNHHVEIAQVDGWKKNGRRILMRGSGAGRGGRAPGW